MRRVAAGSLVAVLLAMPVHGLAQATVPRIGLLSAASDDNTIVVGFREGVREQGYVVGTGIKIEARHAQGDFTRLPALARELVHARVDVLVTVVTAATLAAKDATTTIPIVMVGVSDPIASGIVASLARPDGNVTGTIANTASTAGKTLQLLHEAIPAVRRMAVLWNPENRVFQSQLLGATDDAARALDIRLERYEASDVPGIERAFEAIAKDRHTAVVVLQDPLFTAQFRRIAALAESRRLASASGIPSYAEAGGLIAYGPDYREFGRRAAAYVAKILKGAKPSDLPIEQPTTFQLLINLKTARRLGIAVPSALRLQAHVIE